jgi:hypothetical protein
MQSLLLFVVFAIILLIAVAYKISKELKSVKGAKQKWKVLRSFGWIIVSSLALIASLFIR